MRQSALIFSKICANITGILHKNYHKLPRAR